MGLFVETIKRDGNGNLSVPIFWYQSKSILRHVTLGRQRLCELE
jgi:hypothetical protein